MGWRINQLILEGAGTAADFDHAKKHVLSAVVRLANRQRSERLATFDSEGNLTNKPKTAHDMWIVHKSGTPFFRHYNEIENLNDPFIQDFVDNPMVGDNEEFVKVINAAVARVTCCLSYVPKLFLIISISTIDFKFCF